MQNTTKAQQERIRKHLDEKYIKYTTKDNAHKVGTIRAWLHYLAENYVQGHVKTWEENKIKDMARLQFFRASATEQRQHEEKQKRAGKVTCYGFDYGENSTFVPLRKIEYDYIAQLTR